MYNAWLLIAPLQLCGDYSFESISPLETWSDPRNALTLVFFAVMLWLVAVALRCNCKSRVVHHLQKSGIKSGQFFHTSGGSVS